ncbi:tyrosine-protein kinase SgK223-like [Patagioenas fasciata monilis]|uniref:Tyrosine-protein kinase SgK223-like n=1 Tax=Patagioenas fasciata monilis TaxID=372326 RepID=A0A1V4KWQ1_PATFA|nr:tyrosine-protein kinase SgK223-like [Patagioenas fasciata monilis]
MELEPPGSPAPPGKTQRAMGCAHRGSLDLGASGTPTPMPDTPGGPRRPDSALIYSNVGELRAHLVPRKAQRGEGAGSPHAQPRQDPLPPPLPKKHLQRAESLPEQGGLCPHCWGDPTPGPSGILCNTPAPHLQHEEGAPSSTPTPDRPSWGHKKPLTKSQSLGEPVARSSPQKAPSPSTAELTFGTADGELGPLLGSGVCGLVLGCQAAALARLSARIQEQLLGPEQRQQLVAAELAGTGWAALSVLQREPCCQSADAWYFRVGFTFQQTQLVFAVKVPKAGCTNLGVQSSLRPHCSIQRLISRFTDRLPGELVLPGSPGEQSPSPRTEEPAHLATRPVLQVCMGLEHLQGQNVGQGDLCPENLLLVQCPCPPQGQQGKEAALGLSLPRLLISSFFRVKAKQRPCSTSQEQDWTKGFAAPQSPAADELNVGMLIYQILHVDISLENALGFRSNRLPEIPSLSIYSTGLKRLAVLLLHREPCKRVSLEQARSILQVLLWGPRQELFARSKKTLTLLRSWLELKRALLLLRFAEGSAGAVGSPGLEDWLCCQYFKEMTEHMLYQATQDLYAP